MVVTFVVPDPPPTRTRPGRSADRHSPNAGPLARAGEALVRSDPATFPITFAGMVVVFGRTKPEVEGYEPDHAIYEVLQDVGAVVEPEGWWTRTSQDSSSEFYVVTFTTEQHSLGHP